jgi:hypothetical protein
MLFEVDIMVQMSPEINKNKFFKTLEIPLKLGIEFIIFLANRDQILTRSQKKLNEENRPIDHPLDKHFGNTSFQNPEPQIPNKPQIIDKQQH